MEVPFNQIGKQYQEDRQAIDQAIRRVLESGQYIGGTFVESFEEAFGRWHQSRYAIACANGTDALYLALRALGVGPGDEVITTAFSWISTASAIALTGARPVFVDVREDCLQMDLSHAARKITPDTCALLPVHLYGDVSFRREYIDFAARHGLALVEDAAQVHGVSLPMDVGLSRHLACFSFYPTKQLGAIGDAGAVITQNRPLAQQVRQLAGLGAQAGGIDYLSVGINSRMDPIQAAVLTCRLDRISTRITRRQEIARNYDSGLSGCEAIVRPRYREGQSWYQYVVRVPDRDRVRSALQAKGIGTGVHYPYTLPGTEVYGSDTDYPVAGAAAQSVLSLPIDPTLSDEQVEYVSRVLVDELDR